MLLTYRSKFAQTSLVRCAELSEIDLVIAGAETETETETGASHRAALAACGLEASFA